MSRSYAGRLLRRIFGYLWPPPEHRGLRVHVVAAVFCVFATKVFAIGVPYWFSGMIDSLSTDPATVAAAFNPLGLSVVALVIAHGVTRTMQSFTQEARNYLFAPVVQMAMRKISVQVFRHLHQLGLDFHLSRKTGELSRVIDRGVKAIDRLLLFVVFHIVPTFLEFALVALVLWREAGPEFMGVALAAVTTYSIFTFVVSQWRIKVRQEMNQADNVANTALVDSLINYETVKYFQNEKHEEDQFSRLAERYNRAGALTTKSLAFLNFGQQFIFTSSITVALLLCVAKVQAGAMTLGDMVLVNTLLMQLSIPLHFLGTVYREIQQALADMDNLFKLFEQRSTLKPTDGKPEFQFRGGCIEFRDVHFSYPRGKQLLKGISFTVPAGTSVGIVGPSGCGKSTILRLVFRFFDPVAGQILVDGQEVSEVTLESLRRHIGVIPQDCVLFNTTIRDNIRYGRMDASDAEVEEAARQASIHDAIMGFPAGYDTKVGERGLKMSGGEKQRIAIARCLLRGAPILLADEATSALDSKTEEETMMALRRAAQEEVARRGTALVIAHRLSTVKDCAQILVMSEGEIAESGTHDSLLAAGGLYADMWNRQQQEAVEQVAGPAEGAEEGEGEDNAVRAAQA
eukprot:TRINITY_DN56119_c0_g1_i1.p1 TRINITY_DN56119_c0_g1~~TRINITY_DN56119_c0_g1_i1.p1  ORF type:complete len:688 (+),score=309.66 TRINITY_DN56119_c0_g1_i1:183-2066(+)